MSVDPTRSSISSRIRQQGAGASHEASVAGQIELRQPAGAGAAGRAGSTAAPPADRYGVTDAQDRPPAAGGALGALEQSVQGGSLGRSRRRSRSGQAAEAAYTGGAARSYAPQGVGGTGFVASSPRLTELGTYLDNYEAASPSNKMVAADALKGYVRGQIIDVENEIKALDMDKPEDRLKLIQLNAELLQMKSDIENLPVDPARKDHEHLAKAQDEMLNSETMKNGFQSAEKLVTDKATEAGRKTLDEIQGARDEADAAKAEGTGGAGGTGSAGGVGGTGSAGSASGITVTPGKGKERTVVELGAGDDEVRVRKGKDGGVVLEANGEKVELTKDQVKNGLDIRGGGGNNTFKTDEGVGVNIKWGDLDLSKDTLITPDGTYGRDA